MQCGQKLHDITIFSFYEINNAVKKKKKGVSDITNFLALWTNQ